MNPESLTPQQMTAHLAALADADPAADWHDEEWEEPRRRYCWANGPYGECVRAAGHLDCEDWPIDKHVTFDRDHYDDWPVGWRSPNERVKTVVDPSFGQSVLDGTAQVSDDFRNGFAAALHLVRGVLEPGHRSRG